MSRADIALFHHSPDHGFADHGGVDSDPHSGGFERCNLGLGLAAAPRRECTRVSHPALGRSMTSRDQGNDRLGWPHSADKLGDLFEPVLAGGQALGLALRKLV